jgi:hypothetical protein
MRSDYSNCQSNSNRAASGGLTAAQTPRPVYHMPPDGRRELARQRQPLTVPLPPQETVLLGTPHLGPSVPLEVVPARPGSVSGPLGRPPVAGGGHILAFGQSGGHYEILVEGPHLRSPSISRSQQKVAPPHVPPKMSPTSADAAASAAATAAADNKAVHRATAAAASTTWQSRGALFCFVRASAMP